MAATRMPHFREALLILIVIMMIFSSQNVHTFKVLNSRGNLFRGLKENFKISSTNLYAAKKAKKSHPAVPEFSRVLNVGQVWFWKLQFLPTGILCLSNHSDSLPIWWEIMLYRLCYRYFHSLSDSITCFLSSSFWDHHLMAYCNLIT